jgi:hypothetical protein
MIFEASKFHKFDNNKTDLQVEHFGIHENINVFWIGNVLIDKLSSVFCQQRGFAQNRCVKSKRLCVVCSLRIPLADAVLQARSSSVYEALAVTFLGFLSCVRVILFCVGGGIR